MYKKGSGKRPIHLIDTEGDEMNELTEQEKQYLLRLARQTVEAAARRQPLPAIHPQEVPPRLMDKGASFVTLTTRHGALRGCIGALEPYQPLVEDVREHAEAAALADPRFPPVRPEEVDQLHIEISRLTIPEPLLYDQPQDLPRLLRPGVDGVVLRDGFRRATFLPQVWEKIPDPVEFLDNLCYKMGAPGNLWRRKKLEVLTYQVEEFHE